MDFAEADKLDDKHPLKAHSALLEGFANAALAALDDRAKVKAERGIAARSRSRAHRQRAHKRRHARRDLTPRGDPSPPPFRPTNPSIRPVQTLHAVQ